MSSCIYLGSIKYQHYGLLSASDISTVEDLPRFHPDNREVSNIISDFFSSCLETENDSKRAGLIEDTFGLKIRITLGLLERKTHGIYADRTPFLTSVAEVIKDPDEVWLLATNVHSLETYTYIKYYKNVPLCVVTQAKEKQLILKTWFQLEEKFDKMYRKGLLIKNKSRN